MPITDPEAKREYQRLWLKARREAWIAEHGPCVECWTWDNLEIHHKDPSKKTGSGNTIFSKSIKRQQEELADCIVLCKTCHNRYTAEQLGYKLDHGTKWTYEKGCRCQECRVAHAQSQAEYRTRNGKH